MEGESLLLNKPSTNFRRVELFQSYDCFRYRLYTQASSL